MASGPITSWQIDGETVGTLADYFWGSKITADGDFSHEIKRCLLFGRKVMTNLDSILKSREITLPTKVHLVKAMCFSVVMYGSLPWWLRWLSICLQCRRPGFNPWVGNIPWRRKWQPMPVLLPGKSHMYGCESWTVKKAEC